MIKKTAAVLAMGVAMGGAQGDTRVVMDTSMGVIELALDEAKAPKTVENFVKYARSNFYDGTVFHRVIDGFMIQGGGYTPDLKRKKSADPIVNEATNGLKNLTGTIAMARTPAVDSATCEFFINLEDNDFLDHKDLSPSQYGYAVFGKVTKGMDVVEAIAKTKTRPVGAHENVPVEPVVIKSVKVEPAVSGSES